MKADHHLPPTKEDILAILRAHRELGPEYDTHLADQIMNLWKQVPYGSDEGWHGRRGAVGDRVRRLRPGPVLALSIPLMAIAGHDAGALGILGVLGLDAVALLLSVLTH
ncbi:MAG: hypothetical protein OWU84_07410 [Firmicutes bacterium]|nr:hypothetical protein [Bacillota bacterium]